MHKWVRNIATAVIIAVVVCWVFYAIATNDGSGFPFLSLDLPTIALICGVALTAVFWMLGITRISLFRLQERTAITIAYLEQAIRLNLPLPKLLLAAQATEPRWIASRLNRLRQKLESGASISDALGSEVPGIPARTLALLAIAERVGRVGPELTRIADQHQTPTSGRVAERSFLRAYPIAMGLIIGLIFTLVICCLSFQSFSRYLKIFIPRFRRSPSS